MEKVEAAVKRARARVRVLGYNQAYCEVCYRLVQGLPSGPWVKFLCGCGNKWQAKPTVAVVAGNGHGDGQVKLAHCPECGCQFPLTLNGNGNGSHR